MNKIKKEWISFGLHTRHLRTMVEGLLPDSFWRIAAASMGLALAWGIERVFPFRGSLGLGRDAQHLVLWLLGALVMQALPLAAAVGAADLALRANLGLFHVLSLPSSLSFLLTLIFLDAWTYALHRAYHTVPLLWRFHRVHHCDTELTATTGVRFHPGEVLISALLRLPVIIALGANPFAVVVFEIALLSASQLQHADVCLPQGWSRRLGGLVMTPNLHRSHHSTKIELADSNYGSVLSVWDRSLGTLRTVAPESVVVGAPDGSLRNEGSLWSLLLLPFTTPPHARKP